MATISYDVSALPSKSLGGYKYGKVQAIVLEFWSSDRSIAKIEFAPNEYKTIACAYRSYHSAAKRLNLGITVCTRRGELYLIHSR